MKLVEDRRTVLKEKIYQKNLFMENFAKIFENYLKKVKEIEKGRKRIMEKFEKAVLLNFETKMKNKAENFFNYIFGKNENKLILF